MDNELLRVSNEERLVDAEVNVSTFDSTVKKS